MIKLALNITPVAKGRPKFNMRTGHAYTPGKTRSFESELRDLVSQESSWEEGTPNMPTLPLGGALGVHTIFYLPRPKSVKRMYPTTRPDGDNFAKGLLDALNGIVWKDDSQIVDLTIAKRYCDGPIGRIELSVYELE